MTNSGTIITSGTSSDGIFAESVGGGGGKGGFAVSLSNNVFSNPFAAETSLSNIALGGSGGMGADSGNVTVTNTGSITVSGADSYGIYAQSVSGGGGDAGYSLSAPAGMAVADAIYSTLLGGGSTGQAGTVTINSTGDITVSGQDSMAQFAQSVNGGGGNVNVYLDYSHQEVNVDADGNALPGNGGIIQNLTATITNTLQLGADQVTNVVPLVAAHHALFAVPNVITPERRLGRCHQRDGVAATTRQAETSRKARSRSPSAAAAVMPSPMWWWIRPAWPTNRSCWVRQARP